MKPNPDHEELLHELLDESPAHGPSADAELHLVRAEKSRRRRHRTLVGAVAGLAVLGLGAALLLTSKPAPQQLAQHVAPAPRPGVVAYRPLTVWAEYAHALLLANEASFVN